MEVNVSILWAYWMWHKGRMVGDGLLLCTTNGVSRLPALIRVRFFLFSYVISICVVVSILWGSGIIVMGVGQLPISSVHYLGMEVN